LEFGIQFFPDVGPDLKSAADYWGDALQLCGLCDELGFTNVRTVEHYFHPYGGYSPNPLTFLAAAGQHTRKARLVSGAVLPIFNHPLKLAGEIGMVDALTGGRLEVGFARAFLPYEFERFGISLDESRGRFEEGIAQVRELLTKENVASNGTYHSYPAVTSLPRPTQRPHPPFWLAALSTPETFVMAGEQGYGIMAIPMGGGKMRELLKLYRETWAKAGHAGRGRVMLAFHMFCDADGARAVAKAKHQFEHYLASLVDASSTWSSTASKDYPNYTKIVEQLKKETFESQMKNRSIWIGTPEDIRASVRHWQEETGGFDIASMQVNFATIARADAEASMRLFAREVIPHFRNT
jgi:alkanesulfonate monooxygenase SsuD/methylene tetrahydromethanopterin reductase-like flavin-dependent oxidoreductase (luciferase family)